MKAMLLAAGLATRLRPLTDHEPKTAVPVLNIPLIKFIFQMLRKTGVTEVMINLHYLPALCQHPAHGIGVNARDIGIHPPSTRIG